VVGSIILSQLPEIKNYFKVLFYSMNIQSILLLVLGIPLIPYFLVNNTVLTTYYTIMFILFLLGVSNAILNVPIRILLQRLIPDNLRGRITGLLSTMSQSLVPISVALTGYLLDIMQVYYLFIGGGLAALILTLYIYKIPAMHNLNLYNKKVKNTNVSIDTLDA